MPLNKKNKIGRVPPYRPDPFSSQVAPDIPTSIAKRYTEETDRTRAIEERKERGLLPRDPPRVPPHNKRTIPPPLPPRKKNTGDKYRLKPRRPATIAKKPKMDAETKVRQIQNKLARANNDMALLLSKQKTMESNRILTDMKRQRLKAIAEELHNKFIGIPVIVNFFSKEERQLIADIKGFKEEWEKNEQKISRLATRIRLLMAKTYVASKPPIASRGSFEFTGEKRPNSVLDNLKF